MQKLQFLISSSILLLAAFAGLSCGSMGTPRLQSITISPAANARTYPDDRVPFQAIGHYVDPAGEITLQSAAWGVCQNNAATTAITVSGSGVAQCMTGAKGTYTVFAYDASSSPVCNVIGVCGGGCFITGTAQLTCP